MVRLILPLLACVIGVAAVATLAGIAASSSADSPEQSVQAYATPSSVATDAPFANEHARHDVSESATEDAAEPVLDDVSEPASAATRHHAHDDGPAPAPAAPDGHHNVAPQVTVDETACGNDLVRRTQEATARLADFDVAVAEGYRSNPAKPDATHFANRAYQRDGTFMDLAHPESLVYRTDPRSGEKKLLGALFKMPRGQSGPRPCGAVTTWHSHAACTDVATGDVIPVEHGETCREGYRYSESVQMMHVWFIPGRKNGVAPS